MIVIFLFLSSFVCAKNIDLNRDDCVDDNDLDILIANYGSEDYETFDLDEVSVYTNNTNKEEALSALEVLGFARKQSEKVISSIIKTQKDASVEQLIKLALKNL